MPKQSQKRRWLYAQFFIATMAVLNTSAAIAAEVPPHTFFSGNDIYEWCQHDQVAVQSYVAGMFDQAAHAATVIDDTRNFGKNMPNNDAQIDFALTRIAGYCTPKRLNLRQMTDVFCAYLKDWPAKRDGLPAIMFSAALSKAWPCPTK